MPRLTPLIGLAVTFAFTQVVYSASDSTSETLDRTPLKDGSTVDYVLNAQSEHPAYVVILFPGGDGLVDPTMEDGVLRYDKKANFLLRSRPQLVDARFATVSTNASSDQARFKALTQALRERFPKAKLFLMGTSNGTFDVARLVDPFAEKIDGFVFTSSRGDIWRRFHSKKARVLIVHNRNDACRSTDFGSAKYAAEDKGVSFLAFSSSKSNGEECQPFSPHGYWGIEKDVIGAIKHWMEEVAPNTRD